jgi:hypothetical protein
MPQVIGRKVRYSQAARTRNHLVKALKERIEERQGDGQALVVWIIQFRHESYRAISTTLGVERSKASINRQQSAREVASKH